MQDFDHDADGFRVVTKRRNPFGGFGEEPVRQLKMLAIGNNTPFGEDNQGIQLPDSGFIPEPPRSPHGKGPAIEYLGHPLQRLMQAGREWNREQAQQAKQAETGSTAPKMGACWVCTQSGEVASCAFCERYACEGCMRQCDRCQETFCSFCSTEDYNQRHDRVFCLTCYDEEKRNRPSTSTASFTPWGSHAHLAQLHHRQAGMSL